MCMPLAPPTFCDLLVPGARFIFGRASVEAIHGRAGCSSCSSGQHECLCCQSRAGFLMVTCRAAGCRNQVRAALCQRTCTPSSCGEGTGEAVVHGRLLDQWMCSNGVTEGIRTSLPGRADAIMPALCRPSPPSRDEKQPHHSIGFLLPAAGHLLLRLVQMCCRGAHPFAYPVVILRFGRTQQARLCDTCQVRSDAVVVIGQLMGAPRASGTDAGSRGAPAGGEWLHRRLGARPA